MNKNLITGGKFTTNIPTFYPHKCEIKEVGKIHVTYLDLDSRQEYKKTIKDAERFINIGYWNFETN